MKKCARDFKSGGYNLEATGVSGERVATLILLIAIAYTSATISGYKIKRMGIQKYVGRIKEYSRSTRRHSSFYIGLYGQTWINFIEQSWDCITDLMTANRNKRKYYQRGLRAMSLIMSTL